MGDEAAWVGSRVSMRVDGIGNQAATTLTGTVEAWDVLGRRHFVFFDSALEKDEDEDEIDDVWHVGVADYTNHASYPPRIRGCLEYDEGGVVREINKTPANTGGLLWGAWVSNLAERCDTLPDENLFCFCGRVESAHAFLSEDPLVECANCGDWYHLKGCAGETEQSIQTYESSHGGRWECAFCRVDEDLSQSLSQSSLSPTTTRPAWKKHARISRPRLGAPAVGMQTWRLSNGVSRHFTALLVGTRGAIRKNTSRVKSLKRRAKASSSARAKTICRRAVAWRGRRDAAPSSPSKEIARGAATATSTQRRQRLVSRQVNSSAPAATTQLALGRAKDLDFKRSHIHAFGVFARESIRKDDFIVEYVGELISQDEADTREVRYEGRGLPDYMFRLDKDTIIDATMKGSLARFLNHSCDPNAYTQIIDVGGAKKVAIYAKRDIEPGEELCYDYNFDSEEIKLKCFCGAQNCRGSLN